MHDSLNFSAHLAHASSSSVVHRTLNGTWEAGYLGDHISSHNVLSVNPFNQTCCMDYMDCVITGQLLAKLSC